MNDAITALLLLGCLASGLAILAYLWRSNPFTYPILGPVLIGKDVALFMLTGFFGWRRLEVGPAPINTAVGIVALVIVVFILALEVGSIVGYQWANKKGPVHAKAR